MIVRINELEYDVRMGALSNTSFSRRFRIERGAGGDEVLCHAQCNLAPGLYSVGTPSNVQWTNTAPPTTPTRTMQMEAHSVRCEGLLLHYALTPYAAVARQDEGACTVCNAFVDRAVFHCSRCWYDVCGPCAEVVQRSHSCNEYTTSLLYRCSLHELS